MILIDGLGNHVSDKLGYLKALEEDGKAVKFTLMSELPSLSRPLYETILTGKTPIQSGIVNNKISRLSKEESIFSLLKEKGMTTAAVAYHWIHELYNGPFDMMRDIEVQDLNKNINYGRFYWDDVYPDSHLFSLANKLIMDKNPNFLLLHTMNIDDVGHKFGGLSKEYENKTYELGFYLSYFIPQWRDKGYEIIVTSDHGMNENGNHGGYSKLETEVPLWILRDNYKYCEKTRFKQTDIKKLCCDILEID